MTIGQAPCIRPIDGKTIEGGACACGIRKIARGTGFRHDAFRRFFRGSAGIRTCDCPCVRIVQKNAAFLPKKRGTIRIPVAAASVHGEVVDIAIDEIPHARKLAVRCIFHSSVQSTHIVFIRIVQRIHELFDNPKRRCHLHHPSLLFLDTFFLYSIGFHRTCKFFFAPREKKHRITTMRRLPSLLILL